MVLIFVFGYASCYIQLINIENTHPGMENFLKVGGLSVQAQELHAVKHQVIREGNKP